MASAQPVSLVPASIWSQFCAVFIKAGTTGAVQAESWPSFVARKHQALPFNDIGVGEPATAAAVSAVSLCLTLEAYHCAVVLV